MLTVIVSISLFVVAQAITGVIWGVRLEGKVNLQDQRTTDLKELINARFDGTDQRLGRIEKALNGNLRHD